MKEKDYIAAIKAGLAYTGITRRELADRLDMNYYTLNRKLKMERQHFSLDEMERADTVIRWSKHLGGAK